MNESRGGTEPELLVATEDQSFGSAVVDAIERTGVPASAERVEPATGGLTQCDTDSFGGAIVDGQIAEPAAVIERLTETADLPVVVLSESAGDDDTVAHAIEAGATDVFPRTTASAQYELAVERLVPDSFPTSTREGEIAYGEAYEALFEKISEGLVVHDPETGAIVDVNERFCEMNGYERSELLGEPIGIVMTEEEAYGPEGAKEMIQRARTEGPQRFEWRNQHRDGETFPVEVDLTVIELGDAERVLASVQDITERKRREREYEQIFNSVQDAITVHDPQTGELVDVNETFCELVGYDRETVLRRGTGGLSVQEEGFTPERAAEIIDQVMETGEIEPFEWKVETKRGEHRLLEVTATQAEIGGQLRHVSLMRDITERRQREREYEQIFDGVNDPIAVFDPDTGEITEVNEPYHEMIGYDDIETIQELGIEGLSAGGEYTGERGAELIRQVSDTGDPMTVEWEAETASGDRRYLDITLSPAVIRGEQRVLTIQRDVTERKRREQEYEQIFNMAGDGIVIHDPESGEVVDANQQVADLLGYDRETFVDRPISEFQAAGEGVSGQQAREKIQESAEMDGQEFEWPLETSEGETVWVRVRHETGEIDGERRIVAMLQDITERRRREQEYEQIFNGVHDSITIHDPETGELLDVNDAFCNLVGHDREEIVESGVMEYVPNGQGYTVEEAKEFIREVVETGAPKRTEWAVETADGEIRQLEVTGTTVEIGGDLRYVAIDRDVTERRRREREFEQIFNGVQDAIAVFDPDTLEYLDANEAYLEMFEHESVSELRERGVSGLSITEEGYTEQRGREVHQRVAESGQPETLEWQGETSGGERIWLEVKVAPAVIGGEQRTVSIQRDITERKRREQRLEVFNRILRHNLRNQLDVIQSHAEELADRTTDDHAERIVAAVDELAGIGRRARQVDRILSKDDTLTQIDVAETIGEAVEAIEPERSDVAVTTELPGEARLQTDEETVTMAVESALENAFEHAASAVTVAVEDGPDECVITVADDGPGIPEAELMPIEAETETRLQHGRGLGLWQLRWCVDNLDGELSFETEAGTTVRITVPDRRESGRPG
ncbi:MAG: PAS domain S-box-containing protein [Haloarculaceae archaeon]|jgi:PAS domain S-box-containing protein